MPDSLQYAVLFDLARDQTRNVWGVIALGGMFVAFGIGAVVLARRYRGSLSPALRMFSLLYLGAALIITMGAFFEGYSEYSQLERSLHRGNYVVVEGLVTNFIPGDPHGRRDEQFSVSGHDFKYSAVFSNGGFHEVRESGGPLCDGRQVRITAVHETIVRLEAKPPDCPPLRLESTHGVTDRAQSGICWPWILVGIGVAWQGYLVVKLGSYRIDGDPSRGIGAIRLLVGWGRHDPSNYTEAGRRLLRVQRVSLLVLVFSAFTLLFCSSP